MEGILAFLAVVRSRGSGPFCGRQLPGLAPPISLDSRLARSWGTVTGWEFEATGGSADRFARSAVLVGSRHSPGAERIPGDPWR